MLYYIVDPVVHYDRQLWGLRPSRGAKYCDLRVCMSVCPSARKLHV